MSETTLNAANQNVYLGDAIRVKGARTHNLKNIDVEIPHKKLVVITGLSGSGKSSLAFDTLYAEGQRRYIDSLSTYARQFLDMMEKPDVDSIEGLSPAISIEQKSGSHNPRSTVGTITEIHDYLRVLFARIGTPYCPEHHTPLDSKTVSQIVDDLLIQHLGQKIAILAPVVSQKKGEFTGLFQQMIAQGFTKFRIQTHNKTKLDAIIYDESELPALKKTEKHSIEVVVDRLTITDEQNTRLAQSLESAIRLADGKVYILNLETQAIHIYNTKMICSHCDFTLGELEPRLFSFNSPIGSCKTCHGLGKTWRLDKDKLIPFPELSLRAGAIPGMDERNEKKFQAIKALAKILNFSVDAPFRDLPEEAQQAIWYGYYSKEIDFLGLTEMHQSFLNIFNIQNNTEMQEDSPFSLLLCPDCDGSRLNTAARNVRIGYQGGAKDFFDKAQTKTIGDVNHMSLADCLNYFTNLELVGQKKMIASKILREICNRLRFLNDVGLDYLSLERSAESLSGGEAQRIRLASQIGSGLTGVMYVLDEPSIGLHQCDNDKLIKTLEHLRDIGNTVIVVEHDEDIMHKADHVIDMGLKAGVHGGTIVAQGKLETILAHPESLTAAYLTGKKQIMPNRQATLNAQHFLTLKGATGNNLQQVDASFPVGKLTVVSGVSGSGKSTLINDTLYPVLANYLLRSYRASKPYQSIEGLEHFNKVINIDQSPIGRTPRSNPATYVGLFTPIRELFSKTLTAKERGYGPGRFSFNVSGGRCEACNGDGSIKVEMHFLADVFVNCDVCQGKRYNRETLEVMYKDKNIHDVLQMTVEQAHEFFEHIPTIAKRLKALLDVGLSYIQLGQSAITLSGGEAQRVKLALELSKRDTGQTIYLLDEPTTGLHFYDIDLLLKVVHQLRDKGNTIIMIEHNLDVIKTADYIIDMGPKGGKGGGQIVASGTPLELLTQPNSVTGPYLKAYFEKADKTNIELANIAPKKVKATSTKTKVSKIQPNIEA